MSAPVDCDPLTPLVPDHAPAALHAVAFVEDHVSVELPPEASELGLALILTVGAALVGLPVTVIVVDLLADPSGPVQVSPYCVVLVRGPVDRYPPVETLPVQPPEALQPVTLEVFHHKYPALPLLRVAGPDVKVTDGAYGEAAAAATPLSIEESEINAANASSDLPAKANSER